MNDIVRPSRRQFSAQLLSVGGIASIASGMPDPTIAVDVVPKTSDKARLFDVLTFGAVNDGSVVTTRAIQKAIDTCAKAGGGVVQFPPGKYLSGTILLRSGVSLNFAAGSLLEGSPNLSDYPPTVPELPSYTSNYVDKSLIYGEKLENVGLTGQGVIDGQGHAFHGAYTALAESLIPPKNRPFVIRFIECRNITIKDITLRNSPMWMQHYLACENLLVDGITVLNLPNGERRSFYNNDGIDVDSCQHVRILNCSFRTEDDGLCFKSTTTIPCRDIVASNCLIMSKCNAIKCGTESVGGFQNMSIANCSVYNTPYAGVALESVDGGILDGINISNIEMRDVRCPVFIRLGNRGRPVSTSDPKPRIGALRNVTISNLNATGAGALGCSITGLPGYSVESVSLLNIKIACAGGGTIQDAQRLVDEKNTDYPESTMFGTLPSYGFFVRHAENIVFDQINLTTASPDSRPAVTCTDVERIEIRGLTIRGHKRNAPVISLNDGRRILVHDWWLPDDGRPALDVRGANSSNIQLRCNDRALVESDIEIGAEVSPASVRRGG